MQTDIKYTGREKETEGLRKQIAQHHMQYNTVVVITVMEQPSQEIYILLHRNSNPNLKLYGNQ